MNSVEIEEAVSELVSQPFDPAEFPFQFLTAFGAKDTTIKRLRKGESNASDVAGGVTNGRAPLSDVWEYNPLTNRWLAAAQLPAPRKAPVMALIGNVLYVIGGSPGDNFPQSTVWFRAV